MKRSVAASLLVLAAAASGAAFADDITIDPHPFAPTLTRAEVQAQLQQYKAERVNPWSTSYNPLRHFASSRTRADVTAEYLQSRDEVAALNGEDSGSNYLSARARSVAAPVLAGQPVNAQ
ncbi:MAG TPA: DUF4148 domain-containing protein [Ramlibacter sp.]|uniref:DUF4148 domain-containing protein n=1 Tax=Ramlibacter sp. TaxID=1917967 RepID=UPI002D7E8069|nr:DUF4148 domain-containing protein [Ramlibacter sp.]HET8745810.1 DUF4148 domain-containing protein [Ramlibacter sp.]